MSGPLIGLVGAVPGADLVGAELVGADLVGAELAGVLAEQQRQRAELDQLGADLRLLLREVRAAFSSLAARSDAAAPGGQPTVAAGWRDLDAETAARTWWELANWLGWLHTRFPLQGRVPPCWWRHPAVVEELTALHGCWREAADGPGGARAAAEWVGHLLPAALNRIRDWLPRPCLGGGHAEDPPTRYGHAVDDPAAFTAHVYADAAARAQAARAQAAGPDAAGGDAIRAAVPAGAGQ